ncbi:MAG: hypothetical protein U0841_25200 [Chloroflexia bacterium]
MRGAELLIHEACSTDRDADAAHRFGHSTAADAAPRRRDAGVQRLVLTHFRSSTFADPAALAAEAGAIFGGPIEAASDLQAIDWP